MFIAEELLFSERFLWEGKSYVVHIYRHAAQKERGLHMAATVLGPGDTIISDGHSPEEALHKQQITMHTVRVPTRWRAF